MVLEEVEEVKEEEFEKGASYCQPSDLVDDDAATFVLGGRFEVDEEGGVGIGGGGGTGIAAAPDCSSASAMLRKMASTGSVTTKADRRNDPSLRSTK